MMRWLWKALKWTALGVVAVVALVLIVTAIRSAWAGARLEKKIAALRAAGEPVYLADLIRKPIPPEDNAATYLRRAKSEVEAIQKEVDAAYEAAPKGDQEAFDDGRSTAAMLQSMRAALAAYPNAILLLEQAANCKDYDPQLDWSTDLGHMFAAQMPEMQDLRASVRVLNYHAMVQLADGHGDEALRFFADVSPDPSL